MPDHGAKLRLVLTAFPGQGFAVLDGARFADLPKLCRRERLFARSLFLDHADAEVEKAGPWLVGLGQAPDALDKVLALVGDEPAAVYWCCDGGEAVLYRHLRTLNMARIPAWAAAGGTAPPADASGLEPVPVMFRHWDPRVLGALMPALDGAQFARVLGPAAEVAFLAADYGGVRRVLADPALPAPASGLLAIRSDQVEALNDRRMRTSHRHAADYLKDVAPELTSSMTDEEIMGDVALSYEAGRGMGLRTEQSFNMWCYLNLMSDGRASHQQSIRDFIMHGPETPDDRVDMLMSKLISEFDELGARPRA